MLCEMSACHHGSSRGTMQGSITFTTARRYAGRTLNVIRHVSSSRKGCSLRQNTYKHVRGGGMHPGRFSSNRIISCASCTSMFDTAWAALHTLMRGGATCGDLSTSEGVSSIAAKIVRTSSRYRRGMLVRDTRRPVYPVSRRSTSLKEKDTHRRDWRVYLTVII